LAGSGLAAQHGCDTVALSKKDNSAKISPLVDILFRE
jgi:hypothetical protein